MKTIAYSLALISSLIATVGASVAPRQACPAVVVPNTPITANGSGVSGLQLGNATPVSAIGGGPAILTTSGYQTWSAGGIGGLGTPWCPTSSWLNIGSAWTTRKPLSWSSTSSTTWKSSGGYLTAAATSSYAETSDFLACKPITPYKSIGAPSVQWLLFLNPGDTLPTFSDATLSNANLTTCTKTKLYYSGPSSPFSGTTW